MNDVPQANSDSQPLARIPSLPESEAAVAFGGATAADPTTGDPAQREAADFAASKSRKQLEEEAYVAEHGRSERFRNHFENLAVFALWVSAISIALVALVWLAHMIMPTSRRWLSNEDLSHIQSIVTAGLLVGVIGNHFKKRLG